MSTTVDPNPPIEEDSRANDPWTNEATGTPGSPDTTLVVGNLGQGDLTVDSKAVNFGLEPTTNAEVDGKTVGTTGIYSSAGYSLGAEEDDVTNPGTLRVNTNTGAEQINYDGTTDGASALATVVPGDTTQAAGESFVAGDLEYLNEQPGAFQPNISDGADQFFGATMGSPPNVLLDTLSMSGGTTGPLPTAYGQVSETSGTSLAQFGQASNTPGPLDTTNTSIPTAVTFNNGVSEVIPTSYAIATDGIPGSADTEYGYIGLTAGVGDSDPNPPTAVTWVFGPGNAIVSWTAPGTALAAPTQTATAVHTTGGDLGPGTYYYVVTATNSYGETVASNEESAVLNPDTLVAPVQSNTVVTTTDSGVWGATGTYYYVVTSVGDGESVASNEKTAVIGATTSSATISWAAVTGALSYNVYRGTSTGAENQLVATGVTGLNYKDHGATGGTATPPATAPDAVWTNSVTVNWGSVASATGYNIYRGNVSGDEELLIASVGAVTSYLDVGQTGISVPVAATPPAVNSTTGGAGVGPIREYVVFGYQVKNASYLPTTDTAAGNCIHTVSAHSHASVREKPDGTFSVLEAPTQVEIDHLTPGDYYFFRVYARNDTSTSALSTVVGISYPTAPATPYYFFSEQNLDASQRVIPATSEPEGASLADLTFENNTGINELGNALSGQDSFQLTHMQGEQEEDRL